MIDRSETPAAAADVAGVLARKQSEAPERKQILVDGWRVLNPRPVIPRGKTLRQIAADEGQLARCHHIHQQRHVDLVFKIGAAQPIHFDTGPILQPLQEWPVNGAEIHDDVSHLPYNPTVATAFSLNNDPSFIYRRTIFSERWPVCRIMDRSEAPAAA